MNPLYTAGVARITAWLAANPRIPPVTVRPVPKAEWRVASCAYYRRGTIFICIESCAVPGTAGRSWSWPGYAVDRTPYGVLAHELGHHVDVTLSTRPGPYNGDYSAAMRVRMKTHGPRVSKPLTSYCPDVGEWWAEYFRLFVTNPDLLMSINLPLYLAIIEDMAPVSPIESWQHVLRDAPARTRVAAERRV